MKIDMVMPQMGESITEATISKWLKGVGDTVKKDEVILEISTDKVDSEIPAPASGTITEIKFKQGDVVPVKTIIAIIDSEGKGAASAAATPTAPSTATATPAKAAEAPAPPSASSAPAMETNGHGTGSGKFYSPLVRSLAEKHGVQAAELDSIAGSGQGGRVNKHDLLTYLERRGARAQSASSVPAPTGQPSALTSPQSSAHASSPSLPQRSAGPRVANTAPPAVNWGAEGTSIIPMDNMRQAIADHMVRSKHTSPHVYSVQEVDVTNVSKWRKRFKDEFQRQEGFNLSFTPFFLEAAVKALQRFPFVNASIDGKKIILKKHVNLGCAVALGDAEKGFGLIVPVIKHAEEKNLVGLARSLNDLAQRARSKKLLPDDVAGGTFTVTNPGVFGTMIGTPIINQPQLAILCLGAIVKKPVVIDDMIAIREMCYLTLSYDHRLIDGALGGSFLAFVRDYLEQWDMERSL